MPPLSLPLPPLSITASGGSGGVAFVRSWCFGDEDSSGSFLLRFAFYFVEDENEEALHLACYYVYYVYVCSYI